MKFLNIFSIAILPVLISCSENKNAPATKPTPPQEQQAVAPANPPANTELPADDTVSESGVEKGKMQQGDSLMKVIISFYSIGQGIDRGQTEKLHEYLQSYEKKAGKKIEYSEVHWGREGETDFCFPLTGFSDKQVTDFIKGAKESLNAAEHVHFLQNQVCRKGR